MALVELVENTPKARIYRVIRWLVAAAVLVYVPWFAGNAARIDQFTQVVAFAVAIVGLNLVVGYAGQISLGHSAFVGLGAYTTVILVEKHGWPYLATLPVVIVLCFVCGIMLGLPALRVSGLYMAVVTLALAAIFPLSVLKFEGLTEGADGIVAGSKMMPPSWTPFDADSRFGPPAYRYFVVLAVAVVCFAVARNLVRGRVGRATRAMRDGSTGAAVSGVNIGVVRTLTFGISAVFGGIAGTLLMIQLPQAAEGRFTIDLAIFLLVALFVGGTSSLWGAIPAGLVYVFLPYYAIEWGSEIGFLRGPGASSVSGVIYGVLLIVFAFILRGGIIDGLHRLWTRVVHVRPRPNWLVRRQSVGRPRPAVAATERPAAATESVA